ncbi:sulfite exporter TauE/SafE family protein [Paenibacillus athensensis]|uniref:Probable membrane transporter protein n=1 Tax=Paenibacillus athensensis TaxID=1967502 RepID=A0A4Y8PTP7_9BACL|nr:sulfite exporter TauE/SafE family protein [Paenibacillus athensensis]MCD1261779.1 sulfite exporter TauE/SafE family protein [Paenibacillus athensensis]
MITALLLMLVGLTAGISGSLVGLGGGFIVVPALTFLFPGMLPAHLSGTSMAMLLVNSLSSTAAYARQQRIDYDAALRFAAVSIPGSILGAVLVGKLTGGMFFTGFGCFLAFVSVLLLFKPKQPLRWPLPPTVSRTIVDGKGERFEYAYHRPTGLLISFVTGFLSSLFGVGGGSLMVPTMTLLLAFPPHIAVATSMLQIVLSAACSTVTHGLLHNIDWFKVLFLAPGALIGGQLGARLARKLPAGALMKVLAVMLLIVAVRLIMK